MSDWSERRCEAKIEETLIAGAKALGGVAIKLVGETLSGLPDRLVLLPGGRVLFVELKHPGQRPTRRQFWWLSRLRALGFNADWADSARQVDFLLGGGVVHEDVRVPSP